MKKIFVNYLLKIMFLIFTTFTTLYDLELWKNFFREFYKNNDYENRHCIDKQTKI